MCNVLGGGGGGSSAIRSSANHRSWGLGLFKWPKLPLLRDVNQRVQDLKHANVAEYAIGVELSCVSCATGALSD